MWEKDPIIEELGADYGDQVAAAYGDVVDELEREVLGSFKLSHQVRQQLRSTVRLMHTKQCFGPDGGSGVVVAGMGESDLFPVVLDYRVGTVAAGRLRYVKKCEERVTLDDDAWILPFAQRDTIDMIIGGIYPELQDKIVEIIARYPRGTATNRDKKSSRARMGKVREAIEREIEEKYVRPLMAATAALPRHDLAAMAEALVNLTAFRARMSVTQKEYVGGPIDVAVLSKGEGFVWVKRKDPVWGTGSQTTIEVL